jgi:hypothetical protein
MRTTRRILVAVALATIAPALLLLKSDFSRRAIRARSADASAALSTQTILLPWTEPFSRSSSYKPSVSGSIAGQAFTIPVDTASTGVVVGSSLLPKVKLNKGNPVGWRFLDNNSILLTGQIANLPITFYGTSKSQQAVSQVPVLVVTKIVRCPGFNLYKDGGVCPEKKLDMKYKQNLKSILYMGVGFGLTAPGNGSFPSTPSHNPFLRVMRLSDYNELSMQDGYIISTKGVSLGLTDTNTAGVVWTRLGKMAGTSDAQAWARPLISFTNGTFESTVQARALVDIGATQMYIRTTPQAPLPAVAVYNDKPPPYTVQRVKAGTRLKFAFLDFGKAVAGYEFVIGDSQFIGEPAYVQLLTNGLDAFVNTGRNLLWGFSIVFDAGAGQFGLICENCK